MTDADEIYERAAAFGHYSRTRDLAGRCRAADILIAAVGRPAMVEGGWIKPGATVIDVGINRIEDASKKSGTRLVMTRALMIIPSAN